MTMPLHHAAVLGLSLRAATDTDQPFLATLYRSTREEEMDTAAMPEATRALFALQQFAAQQTDYALRFPSLERWVVMRDHNAVGRLWLADQGDALLLVDISLMPAAQGGGVGSALIRDSMLRARTTAKPLRLHVFVFNRAQGLYARLGFVACGRSDTHIEMEWRP
jgi:GNAT superfamily N-acetyltransferase